MDSPQDHDTAQQGDAVPATPDAPALQPIVVKGRNCWEIARASHASLIVDAADYYRLIAGVMEAASERIFIVGWDFDTRIALVPDAHGKGEPLGRFMRRLARRRPSLQVDVLKWNFGALKQWFNFRSARWLIRWWRTPNIDFRFDSSHPFGCSHHQKLVVIDNSLAACGGIDIADRRWDTPEHRDDEPRRTSPNGQRYAPWHDATMLMRGEIARVLGKLGEERWKTATKQILPPIPPCDDDWPADLDPAFRDVDLAVARTRAAYDEGEAVAEIEALYLDMIAAARRFIYFENQYFTSAKIASAIAARLAEPDPPEIVMVMPRAADGWLEQKAMDSARQRLVAAIDKADHKRRFALYVPVTSGGTDIYVHAKVAIVDDRLLRVGSSNMNNRSMALDSECDIVLDAALPANRDTGPQIRETRHRLIAEHLGVSDADYAAAEDAAGRRMVEAIDRLRAPRGSGRRTLDPLERQKVEGVDAFIADNELLDPARPEAMFDPIAERGLARQWRKGRQALNARRERIRTWRGRRRSG